MQVGEKLLVFLAILLSLLSSPVMSDWRCQVEDRCREYKNCVLDGLVSQCSYAASNATSGGLSFENGSEFFIEWTQDLEGKEQRILKHEGLAMVSNVLTKFWNTEPSGFRILISALMAQKPKNCSIFRNIPVLIHYTLLVTLFMDGNCAAYGTGLKSIMTSSRRF